MLRLPPTTIVLGRSDLNDFDMRRQKRQQTAAKNVEKKYSRSVTGAPDSSNHTEPYKKQKHPVELQDVALTYGFQTNFNGHAASSPSSPHGTQYLGHYEEFSSLQSPNVGEHSDPGSQNFLENEQDSVTVEVGNTPENVSRSFTLGSSPSKDDFRYGGFVESPVEARTPNQSFPFVPDDASTPPSAFLSGPRNTRTRVLSRSPLFISQNASSSPERLPTAALTPRVVSRVATHNTPGLIFAQPARRPPRRSPKVLRHQTNSFSFDSSERASAAYEQDRALSNSTNDSTLRPSEDITLRDELRGSSLQSSRNTSNVSHPAQLSPNLDNSDLSWQTALEESTSQMISSPRLTLPPPFSTVSRSVSRAGSLPSPPAGGHFPDNRETSPVRSPISTCVNLGSSSPVEDCKRKTESNSPAGSIHPLEDEAETNSSEREDMSNRHSTNIVSHAPSQVHSQDIPIRTKAEPQTPSRNYRVYNDSLPRASQPQTPAHLPESRHRSRYHPAYTAPVTRAAVRRDTVPTTTPSRQRIVPHYTPMRAARSTSPVGLVDGGFSGLYGGRENGDEERNWVEGVRFNNAETRLWGSRDAQNDGRNLRETPEPDDFRVGRRV